MANPQAQELTVKWPTDVAAPVTMSIVATAPQGDVDLSTAISCVWNVVRPGNLAPVQWVVVLSGAVPPSPGVLSSVLMTYSFSAGAIDLPVVGDFRVYPRFSMPGNGVLPAQRFTIRAQRPEEFVGPFQGLTASF